MPKIVVYTCMHRRAKVSRLFVNQIQKLGLDIFAVVTEDDIESLDLCKELGVNHIPFSNKRLGAKWNAGLEYITANYDYVIVMGDDDLMTQSYLDAVMPFIDQNDPFGGVDSCYVSIYGNTYSAAKIKYSSNKILGCGCYIRTDLLRIASKKIGITWTQGGPPEYRNSKSLPFSLAQHFSDTGRARLNGQPYFELWNPLRQSSLDYERDYKIAAVGYAPRVIHTETPTLVDVKSEVNIWSFDDVLNNRWATKCDFKEIQELLEK
jgi:glycosyltransferase involved in cell wall biosynthesis